MALDIVFAPHVSDTTLMALIIAAVALSLAGLLLRAPGALWRVLAMAGAILVLANPSMIEEERKGLPDIAVIVADQTQSQSIGDRSRTVTDTVAKIRAKLAEQKDLEVRVVTAAENRTQSHDGGTALFGPLADALADVPVDRVAGAIFVTDGQVHDVPSEKAARFAFPVHALLTGQPNEKDRKLSVLQAPRFGIVNEPLKFEVRVDDYGSEAGGNAAIEIRIDGKVARNVLVPVGRPTDIELRLPHGGENVIEMSAAPGTDELTLANNRAATVATGIRDQLKVLLISGEPHAGERTLRNLLKADPSVDLVHFTILRPPEKQDGTPIEELSLIAFPTRELFEEKITEFDLIILDRYQRLGVLPPDYYENIARYVEGGGALLVASGPDYASPFTIYDSALGDIMPAAPTGAVTERAFRPHVTPSGERHPVTAGLPGSNKGDEEASWGRWMRVADSYPLKGEVVMEGPDKKPLLMLNRVGKGRVALLLSDHAWLWARGYDGGGPHTDLLRRLSHWLMKEPDLEEERLVATARGLKLTLERRSMEDTVGTVKLMGPGGDTSEVTLDTTEPGIWKKTIDVKTPGLYKAETRGPFGLITAVANAGVEDPREMSEVVATDARMKPIADATGGGVFWTSPTGILAAGQTIDVPRISMMSNAKVLAGSGWMGLKDREAYLTRGVKLTPMFNGLAALSALLALMALAWWREGR
mgnify:CR=1 FL=1